MNGRSRGPRIERNMKAHTAIGEDSPLDQRPVMCARADRVAMKRRHDKAAVVAVGPDVEDDYKRQYCERKLAKAGIRQRSASRGPAEPVAVSPLRLVTQQDILQRLGAAAAQYQRRIHGEMVVM
jgi:hypothetical protein